MTPVYVLGGAQTDFARHVAREGKTLADLMRETVLCALETTQMDPRAIEAAHIGNFAAELLCGQGHLGGLFVEAHPAFAGLPTSRHEAACASGSVALLAASADIEAGRYGLCCVLGVEMMRHLGGFEAQRTLGAAAWVPHETEGVAYPWASLFGTVGEEYRRRYGLRREHLAALSRQAFANARKNPYAQARRWTFSESAFGEDDRENPILAGLIRKQDASQITDGGAAVFLASAEVARDYARRHGMALSSLPRLKGFGHRTGRMLLADKLAASQDQPYVFPHVRAALLDAFRRADIADVHALSAVEVHDCFTTTFYMAIDHLGLTEPGQSFRAIEDGTIALGGTLPINPSGGLIGVGHPVGATGVRMVLDAWRQVTGRAGEVQVPNAHDVATLNLGGSTTTAVCFVVGRDE